ncbi:MAG: hypothetical protein GY816_00780 [Cytophagales bacterium]|nr:hypothetical protein [Cytophagales bacterium]
MQRLWVSDFLLQKRTEWRSIFYDIRNIQRSHLDNINKLVGKTTTDSDPAVEAGILIIDLLPWYDSVALLEKKDLHKKVSREVFKNLKTFYICTPFLRNQKRFLFVRGVASRLSRDRQSG